jgi:hypothetical protein
MPTIDSITISNFKGASSVTIDFKKHVDCPVVTFIGLNESGKPVIEKLEYVVPELVGSGPFLVVEGVTDYYALKIVQRFLKMFETFSIMPGVGAGASDPTISSLLGRGERLFYCSTMTPPAEQHARVILQNGFLQKALSSR